MGAVYTLCWGFRPTTREDYEITVGSGELFGPSLDDALSCTLGEACVLTLTGYKLALTDALGIIAGACGANSRNAFDS